VRDALVGTRRLFFALWPGEEFISSLRAAADPLGLAGGRAVADLDLHVTLCFLGAVEDSRLPALCERAASLELPRFELEFQAIEYWSRSRVLVATSATVPAAGAALVRALHAQARTLGIRTDEGPLRAHVTILRGLAASAVPAAALLPLSPPLRLAASNFYLAQSQQLEPISAASLTPDRYARLAAWPLRAPDPEGR
jgi:2'-5' RNA ligase